MSGLLVAHFYSLLLPTLPHKDKKIYLGGGLNMLSQPEFKDVTKVKNLLESLEQEEVLTQIMAADDNETGITEVKVAVKFPDLLKKKLKLKFQKRL